MKMKNRHVFACPSITRASHEHDTPYCDTYTNEQPNTNIDLVCHQYRGRMKNNFNIAGIHHRHLCQHYRHEYTAHTTYPNAPSPMHRISSNSSLIFESRFCCCCLSCCCCCRLGDTFVVVVVDDVVVVPDAFGAFAALVDDVVGEIDGWILRKYGAFVVEPRICGVNVSRVPLLGPANRGCCC